MMISEIEKEIQALLKPYAPYTDFDGDRIYPDIPCEIDDRLNELEELTALRKPIHPSWCYVMRFGAPIGGECCGTEYCGNDQYDDSF